VDLILKWGIKIGDKLTLVSQVTEMTGIPFSSMRGTDLLQFSINEQISWAGRRETTIEED
jgi:hypothetical protein